MIQQLSNLKFCRVRFQDKKPFESDWVNKPYNYEEIQKFIPQENYGVLCGYEDLIIIDCDELELTEAVLEKLPDTFRVETGSGGLHHYFFCPELKEKIVLTNEKHYGEIQNKGSQCVAPGSLHPNGKRYVVISNSNIATITREELIECIKPFRKEEITFSSDKIIEKEEWIEEFIQNIIPKWKVGDRQELTLSTAGYLRKKKKLGATKVQQIISEICDRTEDKEKSMRLRAVIETFKKDESEVKGVTGLKEKGVEEVKKTKKDSPFFIFEKEAQARRFIEIQPLFYDRGDLWWMWDKEEKKWNITDKIDILNGIKNLGVNTINSKDKSEIINALQQVGREKLPKELGKEYVQFKDKIINIKTGEKFESTPKYFSTNPIPWNIGNSTETPTIDRYFKEWVGEEYVKTLYQIIAYSMCSEQFMQRMIALVGGGSNGKGTFIKLLRKFVGEENCVSSELSLLSTNNFETSIIYKKLVCEMGEVSYNDLKNTNQIKKISGEDKLRYCFKGKTPFSDFSSTTCLINTNSLPTTLDKTVGFYRRWLIIDFPNQFEIKHGLIEAIPNEEFENLSNKLINILKEMYEKQKFENEGDYEERMVKYEERSNPVMRFIELNCEEDFESYVSIKKFVFNLNEFIKEKHLRVMSPKEIKQKLIEEGFEVRRGTKNYVTDTYIFNLSLKNIQNIPNIP